MNTSRLVLFPQDADSPVVTQSVLLDSLRAAGLVGEASRHVEGQYRPGPAFMTLLTFLGCSPGVFMGDQNGEPTTPNLYYVELPPAVNAITLIAGQRLPAPKCPGCGTEKTGWDKNTFSPDTDLVCDRCGLADKVYRWHWRRRAGFGRVWINIHGVYPGEAVPGDALLTALQNLTGFVWNYAWCSD